MNGSSNGIGGGDPLIRQNPGANALATKMYADRLKVPLQRDSLDDAAIKVFSLSWRKLSHQIVIS